MVSEGDAFFEGESFDQSLASLTSWHIGGKANRFYIPATQNKLVDYLSFLASRVPLVWLGLGSNVLIRDGGIKGAVICTRKLNLIKQLEDGSIFAQGGVTCAKFARFATKLGFSDAAFFAGIPGTIGGALAMNAGAFGSETWEWVRSIELVNTGGKVKHREPRDYEIGYRSVKGKSVEQANEAFVGAQFCFPLSGEEGMDNIKALLRKRAETQPIGTFNCGSVYRNPPGEFAAKLIEACQLKGYQIGDAMVSTKHANFIINRGKATSQDVESLMRQIESCVMARFGIKLQPEVRILGEREDENGKFNSGS